MHTDDSDYSTEQPLIFWSNGGEGDLGGSVDGTDLMVFEHKYGGQCCRVRTSVEDCVVVVLMNSVDQLHAGVEAANPPLTNVWSARIIPYCRGPIVKFVEAREKMAAARKHSPI